MRTRDKKKIKIRYSLVITLLRTDAFRNALSTEFRKSFKLFGNHIIRQTTYDFAFVVHCNYVSILHRFRDIIRYNRPCVCAMYPIIRRSAMGMVIYGKQESPADAGKPARRKTMKKIPPFRSYNKFQSSRKPGVYSN